MGMKNVETAAVSRRQAKTLNRDNIAKSLEKSANLSVPDTRRLLQELQIYQIELEMQNEELRMTQEQLGESLDKYSDLYEFAPVGYVTSNSKGRILEANLTFAGQLGIDRSCLINTALILYAAAPDRATFRAHLDQVFRSGERHTCELTAPRSAELRSRTYPPERRLRKSSSSCMGSWNKGWRSEPRPSGRAIRNSRNSLRNSRQL